MEGQPAAGTVFADEHVAEDVHNGVPTVDVVAAKRVPSIDAQPKSKEDGKGSAKNCPKCSLFRLQLWRTIIVRIRFRHLGDKHGDATAQIEEGANDENAAEHHPSVFVGKGDEEHDAE